MAREKKRFWFVFLVVAWVLPTIVAWSVTPSLELHFSLLVWQQTMFILGGLWGRQPLNLHFPRFATVLRGLVYGVGLLLFNIFVGSLNFRFVTRLIGLEVAQNLILQEQAGVHAFLQSGNPLLVAGVIVLLIVGAPLGEELFFRQLLLTSWRESLGTRWAIFLSALLFALLHFYLVQFIPVLLAGIILGIMFVRTDNIAIPIIAHAFVNTVVLLLELRIL